MSDFPTRQQALAAFADALQAYIKNFEGEREFARWFGIDRGSLRNLLTIGGSQYRH